MKHPKVGSELDGLIARVQAGEISAEEAAREAPIHREDSIGVAIHLSGNVDGVTRFLEANGASNISARDDYIEAYVPVLLLAETSEQEGVIRVRPIQPPEESQSGSGIPGNGPAVHGSTAWNQAGYTGSGIKVGVVDSGFDGFASLMGTEVPASVQLRCYRGLGEHSQDLDDCGGGSHGTVVAESVMDIAPGASLYISDPQSLGDLRDAVDWMISEGVSVINHSRTWLFDGPGDGTSPFSISPLNTVDRAVAAGIVWVNAAGNSAQRTWFQRGPFAYSTISVDGESVRVLNFEASNFKNRFQLWGSLQLRWDDAWGGASRNLDLLLVAPDSGDITLASIDPQSGGDGHFPYERVSSGATFDVMIANRGGSEPSWIQLLAWSGQGLTFKTPETGSITNPAESANRGMLTVGAAHWSSANSIESYSSRGPTPDGRIKPDLVGADCGQTASRSSPFCGTSQASPHVAGMAALVRQRFPSYSPAQVVSYLQENAEQHTGPDPNNTWGHGFIVLPPSAPQPIGSPSIQSMTPAANSLTVQWIEPSSGDGSAITAYDLRHIETSADETVDANWTVVEDIWTSGSGALSYEVTGLAGGTQYGVQVRSVSSAGDGQWSATVTGTPLLEGTACVTGGAVADPNNNPALVADCDTLLAVRDTLAGNGALNWSASTPIANWDGVEVRETPQRITLLYLPNQGLTGTIPSELGSLTGLTQLTLIDNQLTGPIPSELANLSQLTHIFLGNNRLTGPIPSELGSMTGLQGLELYSNRLTGSIPSELGSLANLRALHIDTNQLTGTIPPEVGRLSNLRWLTLNDNQLTGEVPDELERLTRLEQLWLSGNRFTGCVPTGLRSVGDIDRTHRLKEIGIPYCDELLSGLSIDPAVLSPQFDAYTADYTVAARVPRITFSPTSGHNATFEYLDGDDNVLADLDDSQAGQQVDVPAGSVATIRVRVIAPQNRFGWHTYTFHVTGPETLGAPAINQITPGTGSLTLSWIPPAVDGGATITAYDLRHIDSSADKTVDANWTLVDNVWTSGSGALSYELTGLAGGTQYEVQVRAVTNAADGPWSATAISTPSPADCNTGGAVPDAANNPGLVSDCEILLAIRDALRGTGTLDWSAASPIAQWSGVTIGGRPARVTELYLAYSGLNGVIPAEMGDLANLQNLSLYGNQLSGGIPAALGDLANLKDLSLSFNNLSGGIPAALGSLSRLGVLWLESNQLTGEIPPELGNLSNLVWLWLNQNQLTGEIPPELGSLTQLEKLNLSGNQLTGCVPAGLRGVAQNDLASLGLPDCGLGTLPGAPTGLTATASGPTEIDLSWIAPSDDGGAAITGYRIELSRDGSNWSELVADTGSAATTYTHTGLTAGSTRHYRVSAINSVGASAALSSDSATTGVAPAPDLVVDTPAVDTIAPAAGARFTLSATVRNQGNGRSGSTTVRYYQSTDATITTGDTEVGTDFVSRLDAAESGDESTSPTAPAVPGTYYYGACVDAVTGETDTTNNCSAAVAVTVGAAPAPDLVVDAPTVSESAPVAGARITLNATVRNQGDGRSDSTTLRYYESTDATITTGDTEVGTDFVSRLDAAESGDESTSLTAPAVPGTYYYGACVDAVTGETDTTNNCSAAVAVTVGAAPAPDLVVDAPTVSESAPVAGARITLNATVRNQGDGRSDSTTLRYYQSTDATITTGDTEVRTDFVSRLDAAESGDESTSLTAPAVPGTYYYGACVDAVPGETDTTNNCSPAITVTVGAAPAPDLVVDTPTVDTSTPVAGARFTLSATVRNQGNGSSAFTTLRYYQSTDATITTGDTEVGTDSVSRLGASGTGDESISLTAPSSAGTYYYGACVDAVSGETDTANNCSTAVTVTVGAVASVPGAPTGLTAAANGQTQIDPSWTAPSNDGGAAITGYKIEVSANGSSWSDLVANTGSTATSYSHTGLTANTTRYYRVSAINSVGTGRASNVANATTDPSTAQQVGTGKCSTDGAVSDAANNPGLVSDCETLLAARDALGGTATLNWSADTPIASWDAVTVSGTPRRVTRIDTSGENLNLSGSIPAGLGGLSSLTNLRLSNNQLTGPIPAELGNLSNLSSLSLWNNRLTGPIPAELGNLSNLTFLRLNWNELTGSIPAELGNLAKLESLYLGGNRLSGTIPAELGNLTDLQHLDLGSSSSGENQLTGAIPSELRNLTRLQSLTLWNNRISGTIPVWLGKLTDLRTLILASNQLTGTIPIELGSLTMVSQFWLAHNQLTGTIPGELGNLTNVTELHLDDNRLTGDIPAELAGLSGLRQLFLADNQLTGCIPQGLREVAAQHDIAQLGLPDCGTASSTAVAPGASTGLTGTADGQTEIDLSWTAPFSITGTAGVTEGICRIGCTWIEFN